MDLMLRQNQEATNASGRSLGHGSNESKVVH